MRRIARTVLAAAVIGAAALAIRRLLQSETGGAAAPRPDRPAGSARNGAGPTTGPTREQLYREAQRLEIRGRSKMNKSELQEAVEAAKTGGAV